MAKITASFVIEVRQKEILEKWAAESDRSASYILRQILKQEAARRQAQQQTVNDRQSSRPK